MASEIQAKPITAREVEGWFKDWFKHGPWPDKNEFQKIAERLEQYRLAPKARPTPSINNAALIAAKDLLCALPERERYWRDSRGAPMAVSAEAALSKLRAVLKEACPFIDFPPSAVRTRRPRKQWHGAAFLIAALVLESWKGMRRNISVKPEGPLVGLVVQVLDRLSIGSKPGCGAPPPYATVATMLGRVQSITWLRRELRKADASLKLKAATEGP